MTQSSTYHAVYDFSILPYALGDVLTWSVKACIQAQALERDSIDVHFCIDPRFPSPSFQDRLHIDTDANKYFLELLPAFYTNPMLGNIKIFYHREEMLCELNSIHNKKPEHFKEIKAYFDAMKLVSTPQANDEYLSAVCAGHNDINQWYKIKGQVPELNIPKGYDKEVIKFLNDIGREHFIVTTQFRLNAFKNGRQSSEVGRDSDPLIWIELFKNAYKEFPEIKFLLLGQVQEKPLAILELPNVVTPRVLGYNLGHELGIIKQADYFLGTCSGFSAMAAFTKTPYFVSGLNERSYYLFDIKENDTKFPFATNRQRLFRGKENYEILYKFLKKELKLWQNKQPESFDSENATRKEATYSSIYGVNTDNLSETKEGQTKSTSRIFINLARKEKELGSMLLSRISYCNELLVSGQFEESMRIILETEKTWPELIARTAWFQYYKAHALIRLKQFDQAMIAIRKEKLLQPYNNEVNYCYNYLVRLIEQENFLRQQASMGTETNI